MNTEELLDQFHHERNHSEGSIKIYKIAVNNFEKWSNKTITELLTIADHEETNNTSWKNSTLKPVLIGYRKYVFDNYKERTAGTYFTAIMTIFRHYEITIPKLPYFSTKHINKSKPIYADDLPNREMLKKAMNQNNPLLKAMISFMSSTGIARIDTLNLTVQDWIDGTSDYHNCTDIYDVICELDDSPVDVIPIFYLARQKTGQDYFTFASPESVVYINSYLRGREERLKPSDKLFKTHPRYFNLMFQRTNDILELGRVNNVSRFSPHMLRRYHATQLAEAGMSVDKINVLQGRKNYDVAHRSYIRFAPSKLKDEYIRALPYLVIDDINKYKTELETAREENVELHNNLDTMNNRINSIETLLQEMKTRPKSKEDILRRYEELQ